MSSQPVSRKGDKTTGHGPYQPRPSTQGSPNVNANNIPVNRVGDGWAPHGASPAYPGDPHPGDGSAKTSAGSATVFVNGKPIARIGDPVEADTIAAGSPNVYAG
jgi:uncharacterized Zn-binding protein involved in type VI secretion